MGFRLSPETRLLMIPSCDDCAGVPVLGVTLGQTDAGERGYRLWMRI